MLIYLQRLLPIKSFENVGNVSEPQEELTTPEKN